MLKVKLTVFREGLPANWNSGAAALGAPPPGPAPTAGTAKATHSWPWCTSGRGTPGSWLLPPPSPPLGNLLSWSSQYSAHGGLCLSLSSGSLTCQFQLVHKGGHFGRNHTHPFFPLLWVLGGPCDSAQAKPELVPTWEGVQADLGCKGGEGRGQICRLGRVPKRISHRGLSSRGSVLGA